MACINMFNADHQGLYGGGGGAAAPPPMSPRISFSNDFVLDAATGCPTVRYERTSPVVSASPASDFEFSVESYGMMAADELFFKGRLLPLKEHCAAAQMQRMTLRDELLAGEDDDDGGLTFSPSSASSRLPGKASLRWKTLLGLRKAPLTRERSMTRSKKSSYVSWETPRKRKRRKWWQPATPPLVTMVSRITGMVEEGTWRSACDP